MSILKDGDIGVIGLGAMGSGIAKNLCKYAQANSKKVYLWNRTDSKTKKLVEEFPDVARACDGPDQVGRNARFIFLYLFDGKATQEILSGAIFPVAEKNSVVINGCTMEPEWAGEFFNFGVRHNIHYLSAPIFGRPDVALAGKLVVAVSGPNVEVKKAVRPLFDAIGRAVIDVGTEPPAANVFKLCGNFAIASCLEVSSEAMSLARAGHIDKSHIVQLFSLLFPGSPMAGYAALVAKGEFDNPGAGFTVKGGLKDVGIMKQLQQKNKVYAPTLDAIYSHLKEAESRGDSNKEWSAISNVVFDKKL